MCRIEGADPATVYRERLVCARKSHKCGECCRDITIGESYRYVFSVYDGHGDSYYTCAHCCAGQDWLVRECGGYIFSEVAEELEEHAQEYPALAIPLRRIKLGMRRRWRWFNGAIMNIPSVPQMSIADALA